MACIYNEKVKRNKAPFVGFIALCGVLLICILALAKKYIESTNIEVIVDVVALLVFIYFAFKVLKMSKTQVKYSLISNELLVHKTVDEEVKLAKRVPLENVTSIEKVTNIKDKIKSFSSDITCSFGTKTYRVNYEESGKNKTMMFRPSEALVRKIQNYLKIKA